MLPQVVADKVLQTLAQKTHRPPRAFTIQSSAANQWTDSCLGLAKAGELCAQV
ncbi:MAG: hypothetical protein RLZZ568_2356, partial [Cyanobacteriota bacterium]